MSSATIAEPKPMPKKRLSETERQDRVVAQLHEDFKFPLFNGRQAIESQRKSGYKNTARAMRELIDNAYEAGANNVYVVLERLGKKAKKNQRKNSICNIAVIDDGPGMSPTMARFAMSWGGGTRFEDPDGIGRFGFGLPNASINQTRLVEVYTRRTKEEPWMKVELDIRPEKLSKLPTTGELNVDPPTESELPRYVLDYLKRNKLTLEKGTVVCWRSPDRLSHRTADVLREKLLDDFGVVYRYLLKDFKILIETTQVEMVDPLFLDPGARFFVPAEEGGAICQLEKKLPVKFYSDPDSGTPHLELIDDIAEFNRVKAKRDFESLGIISLRISRLPYGFAAQSIGTGKTDEEGEEIRETMPEGSDERRRLEIRKPRRGFSFVRAGREIDTLSHLPSSASDKASGLGDWPSLQQYAYHWAAEVTFGPELDEAFGIGNDKQTVSPSEDFWRVLSTAGVDKAIAAEESYQRETRNTKKRIQAQLEAENPDKPNPATDAASVAADLLSQEGLRQEPTSEEAEERFEQTVQDRTEKLADETGRPRNEIEEEVREAVLEEASKKRFAVRFFDSEGGVFMKPDVGNGLQTVALINRKHPFYHVFYSEIASLASARPRQVVDLLLLTLAHAELEVKRNKVNKAFYVAQREHAWSPFLKLGLNLLDDVDQGDLEDQQEDT